MVNLLRNEEGKLIGWEMKPTNEEERMIAAIIRDMQFFGFEDTEIVYNGLKLIDPEKGKITENLKSISWVKKKYETNP